MGGTPLSLQLLGSARVALGDEIVLPTRKSLALLVYLALNPEIGRAALAELLWTDRAADEARRNLRQELHRLNALPVGAWIEVRGDVLSLRAGADVDVHRLHAAIGAGDVEGVAALYRGPLLHGFDIKGASGFMDWLAHERDRLARARREAWRDRARAAEAGGDVAGALAMVRSLLADDPLHEELHRDAMRLLHLAGDRNGALAHFERLRELLAAELDVEPQQETKQLARRIENAPEAAAAPAAGAPLSLHAPLIGRDAAWASLEAAREKLAVIMGDAGVGKSRLATEYARSRGTTLVLKGREVSRDTPFYPVAEALWQAYRDNPAWFEQLDPAWRREVVLLLPALADSDDERPTSDLPFSESRGRFLEGLTHALLTAAASGCIVFDDLQWFDGASAELLAHLVRRAFRARLLATARSSELDANPAVSAALDTLARDGQLVRIAIAPLSESEVLLLVRALSGSSGASVFSRRLFAATAGNPLFILESLQELFSAGVLWREGGTWATRYDEDTQDYRELPLSASVRESVLRRIDRLGVPVRRLLEAASLAGDGFDPERLAASAGLSEWEVVESAERAAAARLIVARPPGYTFGHDLIRRALDDALSPERRRLLHRKLAEALIDARAEPAVIAEHLEGGGRAADAIAWRIKSAEAAARVYSLREALLQYERALADSPDPRTAFAVHSARVEHLRNLADRAGWGQALDAMATIEPTLADAAASVELAVKRAVYYFDTGRYADGLAVAEEARTRLAGRIDELAEAQLLLEMGAALKGLGRIDEAEANLAIALERFRGRVQLKYANAAFWLGVCALERDDLDTADTYSQIAVEASGAAGHRRGHAMSLWARAEIAHKRGDRAGATGFMEQTLHEAREIGSVWLQRDMLAAMIARLREYGHDDAANQRQAELDALHSGT